jgi:hypothetical protein
VGSVRVWRKATLLIARAYQAARKGNRARAAACPSQRIPAAAFASVCFPSSFILHPSAFCLLPSAFCLLPSAFCLHPSSFILHPSAFSPPPSLGGGAAQLQGFRPTIGELLDTERAGGPCFLGWFALHCSKNRSAFCAFRAHSKCIPAARSVILVPVFVMGQPSRILCDPPRPLRLSSSALVDAPGGFWPFRRFGGHGRSRPVPLWRNDPLPAGTFQRAFVSQSHRPAAWIAQRRKRK